MGKTHRLYFAFALFLIFFSSMQAAKCNPMVSLSPTLPEILLPFHVSIDQAEEPLAWEPERQKFTALPLITVVSYRTTNEKPEKLLLSLSHCPFNSRLLPASKPENTHLHILSDRHTDGFYLYFLKKLLI